MNFISEKNFEHRSYAGSFGVSNIVMVLCDYLVVLLAEGAAFFLRNFFMTYSVYHISAVYFYGIVPFIFLMFLFLNRLYSGKILFIGL